MKAKVLLSPSLKVFLKQGMHLEPFGLNSIVLFLMDRL